MTPDYSIEAFKDQNARQDQRLDNHGDRIRQLELVDTARKEAVETLKQSVDGLRGDVRKAIGALVVMGAAQIILERLG